MANFIKTQNSFAHGEVSPEFYASDDVAGLSQLENMDVLPGGGLTRRCGLVTVCDLTANARLIPFSVSEGNNYLLGLSEGRIWIFKDGIRVNSLIAPWTSAQISRLQYAERLGTMIFVHPEIKPQVLRTVGNTFEIIPFNFFSETGTDDVKIPFMRFEDSNGINITVSVNALGNNYATLTTNQNFWTNENVGTRLQFAGKQWVITSVTDSRSVIAVTNNGYSLPAAPVSDWQEAAFSARRGWPTSITFHQDRLVFGGSRDHPSGVWMSKVGQHNNFDVGTGLDDEAIFITLMSQQRQQICSVVSSDSLQILTSVGEWAISNKPLTPSVVDIKQHTSVGSMMLRYLPPQEIEGKTVFVSGNGRDIRELSLDELGEKYNANDLCAYAKHLMTDPIDIAYNPNTHQLFVVCSNGEMAVLNQNSACGITAWGKYKTHGLFKSVAVMDDQTYVVVCRDNAYHIEKFSADSLSDVGMPFAFSASALPLRSSGHNVKNLRVRKIGLRLLNSKSVFVDEQRITLPNCIYDVNAPGYTGDAFINILGTMHNCTMAPWRIHGNEAQPLTVLSVTIYGFYTV